MAVAVSYGRSSVVQSEWSALAGAVLSAGTANLRCALCGGWRAVLDKGVRRQYGALLPHHGCMTDWCHRVAVMPCVDVQAA